MLKGRITKQGHRCGHKETPLKDMKCGGGHLVQTWGDHLVQTDTTPTHAHFFLLRSHLHFDWQ